MKKLLCLILLLTACKPADDNFINGYIEGEYVYVAPAASGMLDEVNVVKGQQVNIGDKLFAVDKEIWQSKLIQAQNELNKAYSNYANLSKGKRKQELDVIIEQKTQAQATFVNAEKEYKRAQNLLKSKTVSQANFDNKLAAFQSAKAKVAELEAELETAMLSAREDELKIAQNNIEIAKQNLEQMTKQAQDNAPIAKVSGVVNDVYFRFGEFVTAGNPVVSVLSQENVKIRFFVNEKTLPQIKYNQQVFVSCDGCKEELKAKVSYISPSAEYTPPVIYSNESRDKLVFMVEATFSNTADVLPVGLPVSVRIK